MYDSLPIIKVLTDRFEGRMSERGVMMDFVRKAAKGYLSVQGKPGIGKSALIAQFFKDLSREAHEGLHVVSYFINRGTAQARAEQMLAYLLKKTDELFKEGRGIVAEGNGLWDLQAQLFAKWELWRGQSAGRRMLFLIDGLDEGVEGDILNYLPRQAIEGILFIYGSRPDGHPRLHDLWMELPAAHHRTLMLGGLAKDDIRALVNEVSDKYSIGRETAWFERVAERSEGNPLYLRLLCNAIENGGIAPNDMSALPTEINAYYDAILNRYASDREDGRELLRGLYVFAAARDHLTMSQLGAINGVDEAALHRISSTLREVLTENPLTGDVLDYRLFHESFREYLRDRNAREVEEAAERITDYCEGWQRLQGSWEQLYALQHYAAHLSEGRRPERGETLLALLRDDNYMHKQKRVLRDFSASNDLCRRALLKASELKRTDDMLEAALCLMELRYEEANEAPRVVEMVKNGEIDPALDRIASFGEGNNKVLHHRFILYMLCLMELTLLDGKEKPFAKAHIERILQHLDENLPVDHSILNWKKFFPGYLVFLMACKWAEMGLDYSVVYKRTAEWGHDWLEEMGPYSERQAEVLLEQARCINDKWEKDYGLLDLYKQFAKQGMFEKALEALSEVEEEWKRLCELKNISVELAKNGLIEEGLENARSIGDGKERISALCSISGILASQDNFSRADSVISEAFEFARVINEESQSQSGIVSIAVELARQGKAEKALETVRGIGDDLYRNSALGSIAMELVKKGKVEMALEAAQGVDDEQKRSSTIGSLSLELAKHGMVEESFEIARLIEDEHDKSDSFKSISIELAKQGKVDRAMEATGEVIFEDHFDSMAESISAELAKLGLYKGAKSFSSMIHEVQKMINALLSISAELEGNRRVSESKAVMSEAIEAARGIQNESKRNSALESIACALVEQGKLEKALKIAKGINGAANFEKAIASICFSLANQGKHKTAIIASREIRDEENRNSTLITVSRVLTGGGYIDEALETVEYTKDIPDDESDIRVDTLERISAGFAKKGRFSDALETAPHMLCMISDEMAKQGDYTSIRGNFIKSMEIKNLLNGDRLSSTLHEKSTKMAREGLFEESLDVALFIDDDLKSNSARSEIITELVKRGRTVKVKDLLRGNRDESSMSLPLNKAADDLALQGMFSEAIGIARSIADGYQKCDALCSISHRLSRSGEVDETNAILFEALQAARGIADEDVGNFALGRVSTAFAKLGMIDEAFEAAYGIRDGRKRSISIESILEQMAVHGKHERAREAALGISDHEKHVSVLLDVCYRLKEHGKVSELNEVILVALSAAEGISDIGKMMSVKCSISAWHLKQGEEEGANAIVLDALDSARSITDEWSRETAIHSISVELARQGLFEQAFQASREVASESRRISFLEVVSIELAKRGRVDEALATARAIGDENDACTTLFSISVEMERLGLRSESDALMFEVFEMTRTIEDEGKKMAVQRILSKELARQGKVEKALETARGIGDVEEKAYTLLEVCSILSERGMCHQALEVARDISVRSYKEIAVDRIFRGLTVPYDLVLAEETALESQNQQSRLEYWEKIAMQLMESYSAMESFSLAESFSTEEARHQVKRVWSRETSTIGADDSLLHYALPRLANDSLAIENLLEAYALHCIFFGETDLLKIFLLMRSLDIRYAWDIAYNVKNQAGFGRLPSYPEE